MKCTWIVFLVLYCSSLCLGDVKSKNGFIHFDVQSDGQSEITLNEIGLGVGTLPSSNLHVEGNVIISEQLFIGGGSGSSNLNVNGTIGQSYQRVSSSTTLGDSSLVLADSSNGNLILFLPEASTVVNRNYTIKKTSTSNKVFIRDGGFIDSFSDICLTSSSMGSLSVISHSGNWHILNMSDNGVTISASNLIGWWKLDDATGTTLVDDSSFQNDGSLNNSTLSTNSISSHLNRTLNFDGVDDSVTIPYILDYEIDSISVSAWVYHDVTGVVDQVLSKDNSGSSRVWQFRITSSDEVSFIVFDEGGANSSVTSTNTISQSTWRHIVGTWDGTTIKVYIDGLFDNSSAFAGKLNKNETGEAYIGQSENGSPGYFDGRIDDARIYNKALSASEIQALFSQGQ